MKSSSVTLAITYLTLSLVQQTSALPRSGPFLSKRADSCDPGSGLNDGVCVQCAPGQYQDESNFTGQCKECEAGTFSDQNGQQQCTGCPPDQTQSQTGQTRCIVCIGHVVNPTICAPPLCPPGGFTTSDGNCGI